MKSIARRFGYEIRKIPPPQSPAVANFLNAEEAAFEPDVAAGAGQSGNAFDAVPVQAAGQAARSLIVEGWRFLPHSYAIVNQWQLLSLSRRSDLAVKLIDAPVFNLDWQRQEGLFAPRSEQVLKSIETAAAGESADLTLRLFYPYDFSPSSSRRTAVFGTAENQVIQRGLCADYWAFERFRRGAGASGEVQVVTPSRWSAEGFYRAGFRSEQVHVVPHGVDVGTFRPMPDVRGSVRAAMGLAQDAFVFLSVGAMTANKGIDALLQAFTEVSRRFPHARLVLKGMNPLYHSRDRLLKLLQQIPAREQDRVVSAIRYYGNSFSNEKMALLYQAADTYVSPYQAEGFNMPVLEAAACGLPVICTRGGPTDDFVTDAFAGRIESTKVLGKIEGQEVVKLKPDVEHLTALMIAAIEGDSWRRQAAAAGPAHVRAHYTWDLVTDMLVRDLLN